jgi:hypothetical protein
LNNFKDKIRNHQFENCEDEINVFKNIKTELFAKLIYYQKLHSLESEKILGSSEFLQSTLFEIKQFKEQNKQLYLYYKSGATHLDKIYFMRYNPDNIILFDDQWIELDKRTDASHTYVFAKFKAFDLLLEELQPIENNVDEVKLPNLQWTHSKIALIELIYAIAASKTVNEGKATIKDLTKAFSTIFKIELKEVYREFVSLKNRSESNTFLKQLIDALNSRIEDEFGL